MKQTINTALSILLMTCCSCTSNRQYTSKPTKSLVNPDSDVLEVNALAYHTSDTTTAVYVQVTNENLLYRRPDTTQAFYAELRVAYKLLTEQNGRRILDSGTLYMRDRADDEVVHVKSLVSGFNIQAKSPAIYYLELEVFDLNRHTRFEKGLNIYKQSPYSAQNFLVTRNDSVAFKNHFIKDAEVTVRYANPAITRIQVNCFFREFGTALPPFSTKPPDEVKYKPDSVMTLFPLNNSVTLAMPERGFYHLTPDPVTNEGVSLFTHQKTFPGVGSSQEMINCTRYLMSKEEYEECRNAEDKKAAIDKFWLNIGGSNERARELLKRYYGRVKEANKYYTSYTQGWKSDRGMIFIVFGPPTNLYHSKKDEVWVYGNEANPATLRFVFNKTTNPFSDNDYVLERSQFYKEPWYSAVEYWRQGQVYLDNSKK